MQQQILIKIKKKMSNKMKKRYYFIKEQNKKVRLGKVLTIGTKED